jgi:hypothetical protein
MNLSLAYAGQSGVISHQGALTLQLQPNLSRDPVAFDAPLLKPLRFREAISALHDVVISDLRFKLRDKTSYKEWKQAERDKMAQIRGEMFRERKAKLDLEKTDLSREAKREFKRYVKRYWKARRNYEQYVMENDPELWRLIMPYDPVITVADDVVFFECFSADESSYGCLTVNREDGFGKSDAVRFGTTNVDYSWDLYNHFQRLRTYRDTRFQVDPTGFEVKTEGMADYREEKIDLPGGWLRGFMQIQAAMGMPMRKVSLSREAVYSLLAWFRRNREKTGPRAIRFELLPGTAPRLVLEPWEKPIVSHGAVYNGPSGEPIRVWGRRRLMVLARALPLIERVDVHLLGTGLPSFWVAHMGEMKLTLGLSGWTANDWTRGSALDLLAPPGEPRPEWIERAADFLRSRRAATFDEVDHVIGYGDANTASVLNHLAHSGQVIHDLASGLFRWRQILPMEVGAKEMGEPNPELVAALELIDERLVTIESRESLPRDSVLVKGTAERLENEMILDGDGLIKRASCSCSHHKKYGIRRGPCRHLLALRNLALQGESRKSRSLEGWYNDRRKWAEN